MNPTETSTASIPKGAALVSDEALHLLNEKYKRLSPAGRLRALYTDFHSVMFTSSFGTTAVILLHMLYQVRVKQTAHFINTTFHFDETLAYKDALQRRYDLEVIELLPDQADNHFARVGELWKHDPDACCRINKVAPFAKNNNNFDVWISGLMAWQGTYRKSLNIFERKGGSLKFYPIIDVTEQEAEAFIIKNQLPVHPLKPLGYQSIGCRHCTVKGEKRTGRWSHTVKTECGLHT
jgi:phosphoadenosine phosphosulfate reductase